MLDLMLPGLSGIELCRRVRARSEIVQLPIITLTARGGKRAGEGLATGADDYIVKPFSVPELLARVKGLMRRASPEQLTSVTVDVHIGRLRKLLNPGREQDPIRTVRGAGYALEDKSATAE